ncbi:hypothetical protein SARC_09908 [Sphaeroforma arctica JP610]|uniref:Uncharacterized protein n=1 Tax=Sphaeroforma arctica JP610 TaxID=667725 RepID=A0A0L0FMC7_9EUKA|nr:hypothetical protein SARC_09908 [Sphaeroforma arctica JP610]KNC77636.1 hypothetical protein SARC_09908 [Sphaeroforma arctica JP610]|eukprot:XP_014151538.1 hypothetical protein SARC_09908 [Sphaeroforma arctica JP610]
MVSFALASYRSWVLGVRNGIQPNVAYTYSWGEQAQPARESSGPQTEREVNMRTVTRPRRFLSEDQSQFFTQTHEKSPAQSPQQSPSTGRKGATDTGTGTSTDTGTGATGTNMGAGVGGSIQVGGGPRTVGNQGYEVTNMDVLHTQYTHSRSADSHAHTADGLKRLSAAQLLSEPEHPPQTRSGATSTPQHLTHRLGRHGTPQDTSAHSSPHAQDEGHPQATGGHTSCGHTHSYLPARDKVKHRCIVSGILYDDMGVEGNAEMLLGPRTRMTLSAYSSYPPYNARATNSHNTPATTHQSPAAAEAAESQLIAFARHTSANGLFTTTGLFMSGGMVFGTSLLVKPPR